MRPFTSHAHLPILLLALLGACGYAEPEDQPSVQASASLLLPAASAAPLEALSVGSAARSPSGPSGDADLTDPRDNAPAQIRGLYLNSSAASPARLGGYLELAERTEINAFVVDIKTESGIHYRSADALARELTRPEHVTIQDLEDFIEELHDHGIWTIARIVAFKDPVLVAGRPAWAIRNPDGGIWIDREGNRWVSAWHPEVWEYNIRLAEEAARAGFDEIQFDYVRFPEQYQTLPPQIHREAPEAADKTTAIATFLERARDRLHPLGAVVAADVFGMSMNGADDVGIGQQWERLATVADHLLPMVYPSHYSSSQLPDIARPNRMPGQTIETAVGMGVIRNSRIADAGATPARIIPWLQAFDAPWVDRDFSYGPEQVRAQIEAVYEVGLEDWILWHPGSRYSAIEPALEPVLAPRAKRYDPPASLVRRMDRYEDWGMRASRARAIEGS